MKLRKLVVVKHRLVRKKVYRKMGKFMGGYINYGEVCFYMESLGHNFRNILFCGVTWEGI